MARLLQSWLKFTKLMSVLGSCIAPLPDAIFYSDSYARTTPQLLWHFSAWFEAWLLAAKVIPTRTSWSCQDPMEITGTKSTAQLLSSTIKSECHDVNLSPTIGQVHQTQMFLPNCFPIFSPDIRWVTAPKVLLGPSFPLSKLRSAVCRGALYQTNFVHLGTSSKGILQEGLNKQHLT